MQESPYIVASVDRAIELLLMMGKSQRDLGVTELSKMLGVQKSTVHSLLQTLLARGFVRQTDAGRYTLGIGLIPLGISSSERLDIRTVSRPIMEELANATQEVAMLALLAGGELVIVDKAEPQRPFIIIPNLDYSMTLHSTAIGKVLLANAGPEIMNKVLDKGVERFTPYTITEREALTRELEKVKNEGYAVGCNETIEGVTCIAVPVNGSDGQILAALSISSSSAVMAPDRYQTVISVLKEKARLISRRLGYPGL